MKRVWPTGPTLLSYIEKRSLKCNFLMETEKTEKDLIVDVGSKEVQIALMENHRLIELNKESSQGHTYSIGDVFLGRCALPPIRLTFPLESMPSPWLLMTRLPPIMLKE